MPPQTWGGALDKRRDLWHIDVRRCRRSTLYEGFECPILCARDEWETGDAQQRV